MTTRIYGAAKPSLEDALAHHGVKGQRWGVRKEQKLSAKAANPNNSARKNRNLQIKLARVHVTQKQMEINDIVRQANKAKDPAQRQKLDALATKKASALFNHPDTLTASRMTTGEKIATGLLIGASVGVAGASGAARAGGRAPAPRGPIRTTAFVGPH